MSVSPDRKPDRILRGNRQVGEYLSMSEDTVERIARRGQLRRFRINRIWAYRQSELDEDIQRVYAGTPPTLNRDIQRLLQEVTAGDRATAIDTIWRNAALIARLPEDEGEKLLEKIQDSISDA